MILSNNIPWSWLLWSGIICIIYSVSWLWMEKEAKLSTPGQLLLLTKKHIFLFVDPSLYACYCWKNVIWGILCVCVCVCVSLSWFQRGTLKLLDPFKVWVKAHDFGWPTKNYKCLCKTKDKLLLKDTSCAWFLTSKWKWRISMWEKNMSKSCRLRRPRLPDSF